MNKNEQLAEQSLVAQQGFFGMFTDAGYDLGKPVPPQPNVPIPACLQLHITTATGTADQTKFDTQGPYGKHVYGLPVIPESVDDIRYKKPDPEEYGWEPNSTTSSNGWPDEESQCLYEEAMLEWQRDLFLAYGSKEPQVPNHVKGKEFVSPLDAYLRTLSPNCTMVGDSQNAGTAGETPEEEIQTPIMSDSMLALYGAILEDFYAGTPGNPKEEIQKLRGQFRELITDNAKGTYKRGHNGQLIADEVCVEGLIDDLLEFFNSTATMNNEETDYIVGIDPSREGGTDHATTTEVMAHKMVEDILQAHKSEMDEAFREFVVFGTTRIPVSNPTTTKNEPTKD